MRKKQNTRRNIAERSTASTPPACSSPRGSSSASTTRRLDRGRHGRADRGSRDPGRDGRPALLRCRIPSSRAGHREGRLHKLPELIPDNYGDQCTLGLNFETLRPRRDILGDYERVLQRIYEPEAFAGRLRRLAGLLDNSNRKRQTRAADARRELGGGAMLQRLVAGVPEPREVFRQALSHGLSVNPRSARSLTSQMALYLHLGPFSRHVIREIELKIERLDAEPYIAPLPAREPVALAN